MTGEIYTQALRQNKTLEEKKKTLRIVNLLVEEITNKRVIRGYEIK